MSVSVSTVRDWFWETGDIHQTGQTGRGEDTPGCTSVDLYRTELDVCQFSSQDV